MAAAEPARHLACCDARAAANLEHAHAGAQRQRIDDRGKPRRQ
jgi:hypothetical protein